MSKQPVYDPCLDNVAQAIAADDRESARNCVETNFEELNKTVEAWLVRAWTCNSLREAESSVQQALKLNPSNELALAGMNWLLGLQEFADTQLELKRCDEEQKRMEAEEQALREAEERARIEAEEQARREAEEQARREAEEKARIEAEEKARLEAEEKAKQQAEDQRRLDETVEKVRLEVEQRKQQEAEKQARWEAEEQARIEAEEQEAEKTKWQAEEQAGVVADKTSNQADDDRDFFGESETPKSAETSADPSQAAGLLDEVQLLSDEINKSSVANQTENNVAGPEVVREKSNAKNVVLAVDDSPTVRKLVALTLTREGFEVIEAENGIEALNILGHQLPDIILSDINMPKLNGYKLCKFVKKHERTKNIPVVMLSGKDGVFDKMRGKLSGCDDFISKPFESSALVEKVREHLKSGVNA